jgi:hypothetical protein
MAERQRGANGWVTRGASGLEREESQWLGERGEPMAERYRGANGWVTEGGIGWRREGSQWLGERGESITG